MALKVASFESRRHIRSGFCCGKDSLENYIQKQASQDLKRRVSTVFVLINEPEVDILAYYTLCSYTIETKDLDEAWAKRLPRLAVDNGQKGNGFGKLLLIDALKRSLDTSVQVASLAVIAQALDENALRFYLKYGFQQFRQAPLKLYLPMNSVKDLFQTLDL